MQAFARTVAAILDRFTDRRNAGCTGRPSLSDIASLLASAPRREIVPIRVRAACRQPVRSR